MVIYKKKHYIFHPFFKLIFITDVSLVRIVELPAIVILVIPVTGATAVRAITSA